MTKTRLTVIVSFLVIAAVTGTLLGKYYSSAITGAAKASGVTEPPTPGPSAEWADLNVVYLLGPTGKALNPIFDPAAFAEKINAQVVTQVSDVTSLSANKRIDVLIVDASSLNLLEQDWAKSQYAHGTAFVGLNLTPNQLGTFIGDEDFANNKDWLDLKYAEPFVSQTMYRVNGDPDEIAKLEKLNALFPVTDKTENTWIDLGIKTVSVSSTQGYISVVGNGLIPELDNIRINIPLASLKAP